MKALDDKGKKFGQVIHPEEGETGLLRILEIGDGAAHVFVSILLLLLAIGILVFSTWGFVSEIVHQPAADTFPEKGLRYLSDLLFGVIVLELLSTILTYIKARKLEATIKDFLVVAIISSIRKILLVGAQSSMEKTTGDAFIKEAIGTAVTILGIILLIGGLLFLTRFLKPAAATEEE